MSVFCGEVHRQTAHQVSMHCILHFSSPIRCAVTPCSPGVGLWTNGRVRCPTEFFFFKKDDSNLILLVFLYFEDFFLLTSMLFTPGLFQERTQGVCILPPSW